MEHHTRSSTNFFAASNDLANDYNTVDRCYDPSSQSSVTYVQSPEHPEYHSNTVVSDAPLRVHVERAVREYFATLGDELPTDLYELILREVELPLLTVTLEQTRGNQTKCAHILGLNRGTLRKKLKNYNLMS